MTPSFASGPLARSVDAPGIDLVCFHGVIGAEHAPHHMADEGDGNGGGVLSNFPGDFPGPGQERIRCQYFLHEASGGGLLGLEHAGRPTPGPG